MTNRLTLHMRFLALLAAVTVLAAGITNARAADATPHQDLVKAELLSDVATINAGQPFYVGVRLKMKPHWHVYWKNPGDSGLATSVKWTMPDGFNVGPLQFPIPVKFDQPGDVAGYGYEDEVMLLAEVTPPADLAADEPIEIKADVSWLVCEKVCIPGKASLALTLPNKPGAAAPNEALFKDWLARLPRGAAQNPAIKETGLRNEGARHEVFVAWQDVPKDVQWFPAPPEASGVENMQTTTRDDVSRMSFALVPAPKGAAPMTFLVAYTDQTGKRQGVEFTVNLPAPAAK